VGEYQLEAEASHFKEKIMAFFSSEGDLTIRPNCSENW